MPEHIHKLKRHKYKNGTEVYFCTLNCNFKVEVPVALGKLVICNICNEPFTMTEYTIKLARPHCSNCGKQRIKNEDGTVSFVNKSRLGVIAADLADKSVSSLRERLGTVVQMEKRVDEDI